MIGIHKNYKEVLKMIGLFILGLIGLIIYNIIDTQSLINNVRCILLMLFSLCALRAMAAYTDR